MLKAILGDLLMIIPSIELLFRALILGQTSDYIDEHISKLSAILLELAMKTIEE